MKLTLSAIKSLFRKYDRKLQRGIDGVKAYVDESAADWNQSDETAPDYVKNRTHYDYVARNKVLTITIPAAPIVETGDYAYNFRNGELNNYKGKRGDTVLVVFDGVEYYCTQVGDFNDSSTNYGYVIGNTSIVDDGGGMGDGIGQMPEIDTGEPFAIWNQNYYMSNSGIVLRDGNRHTIEVYELKNTVKPLDDKYIPDNIVRSEELNEAIDYVNRTLPRSDWNQNDGTQKDFILGRTHYTESRDFTYSVSITLDNSGGWMRKNDPDFAKALFDNWENATFTKDGRQIFIHRDSIEYNTKLSGVTVDFYAALGPEGGGNSVFLGINLTDGFVLIGEDSASWGSVHITFPVHEEIVHPLDEKYIPESIARKSDIPQGGGSSDIPDIPSTLPNPHPLTFTGAVEATYDGSTPVTVEIPMGGSGGGYKWELIEEITLSENVASVKIDLPLEYSAFSIVFRGTLVTETNTTLDMRLNNDADQRPQFADLQYRRERPTEIKIERRGTMYPIVTRAVNGGARVVNEQKYVADIDWKAWNEFTFVTCCATNNEFASGYEITVFGVKA